mgnify:CR=1 FL=1
MCDTDSSISCLKTSISVVCCNSILKSSRNPFGANGLPVDNKGDILGQIQISNMKYDGRFTLLVFVMI